MPSEDLGNLELKLFVSLFRTNSLKASAGELMISSQAAGRQLEKLRTVFNDPLFTRNANLMEPTEKASEVYPQIKELVDRFDALFRAGSFDPAKLERQFHIAAVDNAAVHILTSLIPKAVSLAPHTRYWISNISETTFPALKNGSMDLALFPRVPIPPDYYSLNILTSGYCYVTRKGHPLEKVFAEKGVIGKRDVNRYPCAVVNAQPDTRLEPNGPAKGAFNPADLSNIKLIIPYFLAAPYFLLHNDWTVVAPIVAMKKTLDPNLFSIFPVSEEAPKLTSRLVWHKRVHRDPAIQWLRSLFIACRDSFSNP
jgi:transcriptional regulator, lysR family, putative